jgi:hypothetical protein
MRHSIVCALAAAASLAGCKSTMYGMTGDTMAGFTVDHATPYLMESDDADMACKTGAAMGAFVASFGRVTDPPDKAALGTLLSAATCAEADGWEAELRGLRALRDGRSAEGNDARIAEKRAHELAAKRYYGSYRRLVAAYGEPGEKCPEFEEKSDELLYMVGLLAGVNAVQHDRQAAGAADVPLDVPRKVERGATCLDDARWFGVPSAIRAAVWLSVPGATPEGTDPWAVLAKAAETGDAKGMRLARAIQVQSALAQGRDDLVKQGLAAHAASLAQQPAEAHYRLLDRNAWLLNLHVSDIVWTREAGHRTPYGSFGQLPEKPAAADDGGGLLDELTDEPQQEKP